MVCKESLFLQSNVLSADCCQRDMSVADCRFWEPMDGNGRKLRAECIGNSLHGGRCGGAAQQHDEGS